MKRSVMVIAALASGGAASPASADLRWRAEVALGEPTPEQPHPPPTLWVHVVGEPLPARATWTAMELGHDPADVPGLAPVRPLAAVPYHRSRETLGLVVLVEGHEYFFGNDTYKEARGCDDPTATDGCKVVKVSTGVYPVLRAALDPVGAATDDVPASISQVGPPGSRGALLVYSVGTEVRFDGDLARLTGERLGDPRTQEGKTSRDLADGLRAARRALQAMDTRRKVLLVFSDGVDGGGTGALDAPHRELRADGVEVFAFHLDAGTDLIGDDPATKQRARAALERLADGQLAKVTGPDDLRTAIAETLRTIDSRYALQFPGVVLDRRTHRRSGFRWDGRPHRLVLTRDGQALDSVGPDGDVHDVVVVLAPTWSPGGGRSWAWLWLAVPGALMVVGVGLLMRRRPATPPLTPSAPRAPGPPPAPAPPIVARAEAPRTAMIDLNTGDGLPVVGWLVPIRGARAFETFQLRHGETRIGTTPAAHVVLADGFMSTDHARIVMSPTGFTLIDNDSTNGTFANERRIHRHELVDNDLITFGQTVCKFKAILGT